MKRLITISSAILVLLLAQLGYAQQDRRSNKQLDQLTQQIKALQESQTAIQKQLLELKQLLEARLAPAPGPKFPATVSLGNERFRGDRNARVVVIDFSDYQCPFCGRFVRDTMPQIYQEYVQSGKIKYVFRDLPLESIHPLAFKAAEAARCAGEQDKFWEMHDRLYQNQNALDAAKLPSHAQALGLDMDRFTQCLNSDRYSSELRKAMADATSLGIQGTPNFLIGVVENPKAPTIKVLKQIVGAQPFPAFKAALDDAIATASR